MADHFIVILPDAEEFLPATLEQRKAERHFSEMIAAAEEYYVNIFPVTDFEQEGDHYEMAILCPYCGSEIDLSWQLEGDVYIPEESNFLLNECCLPCCGRLVDMHLIKYHQEYGIVRFALSAIQSENHFLRSCAAMKPDESARCMIWALYSAPEYAEQMAG